MRVPLGMVHGRFQPFHNEHLDFVLTALERSDRLVVGITNPDSGEYEFVAESAHRSDRSANPYSFYDRYRMVHACLADSGVSLSRVMVVPFHLFHPQRWCEYGPRPSDTTMFMRMYSEWEVRKAAELQAHGFTVVSIDEGRVKKMTATQVRDALALGGDWRALVPAGSARIIDEIAGSRAQGDA